jgi:hypothetical protein
MLPMKKTPIRAGVWLLFQATLVSGLATVPAFAQYRNEAVIPPSYGVNYGPLVIMLAAGILAGIKCSYIQDVTGEGAGCLGWGGYSLLYLFGIAIPLLPLVWIIWPNLLLSTSRPAKEGVDVDLVKRQYRGKIRLCLGIAYSIFIGIFLASLPWQLLRGK